MEKLRTCSISVIYVNLHLMVYVFSVINMIRLMYFFRRPDGLTTVFLIEKSALQVFYMDRYIYLRYLTAVCIGNITLSI